MIDVWGADHGGYVKRMKAAVSAITEGKGALDVKLCQLVRVLKNGELVRMSKRAGSFVTLRDLLDEVGPDVVRFTMLTRKNDASFDFDLVKATEQSRDNPVWYVQYAHARTRSVMRQAAAAGIATDGLDDGAARSPGRSGRAGAGPADRPVAAPGRGGGVGARAAPHRLLSLRPCRRLPCPLDPRSRGARPALRRRGRGRAQPGPSRIGTGNRFCDRIRFKGLRRNTRRRDEIKNAHPPVPLRRRSNDLPAE